jgi:hypothetical protein
MHVKISIEFHFNRIDRVAGYVSLYRRFSPSGSARRSPSVRPAAENSLCFRPGARDEHDAVG